MRSYAIDPKLSLIAGFGLLLLASPLAAQAQTALCPFGLQSLNGSCTDGRNGAFSGAALASQAVSELSATSTQETTQNAMKSITERREQERARVSETPRAVEPPRAVLSHPSAPEKVAKRKIPNAAAAASPAPEASLVRQHRYNELRKAARYEAPAERIVLKGPEPEVAPPVVEPAYRFGTWAQIYGDYERRSASGTAFLTCCLGTGLIGPGAAGGIGLSGPPALAVNIQSRTGTVGFLAGADGTTRGVFLPNDGLIAGLMTGYVGSNLTLNTTSVSAQSAVNKIGGNTIGRLNANLTGPTAGLFATYFAGAFSSDFMVRADFLTVDESFNDVLGTTGGGIPSLAFIAGSASIGLINTTIASNLNYRFDVYPNVFVEPTVGALYTNSSYGGNAFQLGLADGDLVRVQGGARFGFTTLVDNRIPVTTTLTGLAYDDVLAAGGFVPAAAFSGSNLLNRADQGKVRGRGVLAFNADLGHGMSAFIQGEARGGSGLFGAGGKAGIRYQW